MSYYRPDGPHATRWETRSVTALPTEWTNVFYSTHERDAGRDPWDFERCPAILLAEKVADVEANRHTAISGTLYDDAERPIIRETEVRFATVGEFGDLEPLGLLRYEGPYLCTVPGGKPDQATREKLLQVAVEDGLISAPTEGVSQ
ncbi:hypothetical protein [Mycobacterium sp. MUNTM1]